VPLSEERARVLCYGRATLRFVRIISHRQLRNESGAILRAVRDGESFLIANNGSTVARLDPAGESAALKPDRPASRRGGFGALTRYKGTESVQDALDDLRGER
jgi:prevent-host-death family protein